MNRKRCRSCSIRGHRHLRRIHAHRSGPNRSDRWRRQLYLSYNKFSEGGHQRPQHYREFRDWLRTKYAEHGKTETYFC